MNNYNETLKLVQEGKHILFTFKSEAEQFAKQAKLKIIYDDGSFIEQEHYDVKGYNAKLYWIAP